MKFPNFNDKHSNDSMVNPDDFLQYLKSQNIFPKEEPPHGVILSYDPKLSGFIKNNHQSIPCGAPFSRLKLLTEYDKKIGVIGGFGVGSPAASIILEELIAFGVKKFISIGTAGALQKTLNIGDLILCEKAVRDEGTSHHYLKPEKFAHPSKHLTNLLAEELTKLKLSFKQGPSWTIDAPYRETIAEARHYQEEGVLTVEMEASALFAVSQFRKVEIAALFTISDSLADFKWKPNFLHDKTQDGLQKIFKAAVSCLSI